MATLADLDRRVELDRDTGCLRWTGAHTQKGYGQIVLGGKGVSVHRAAYERAHGPIPNSLEVDHVHERGCRYRDCINTDHLEAVTHAENVRRQLVLRKTCKNGHPWTAKSTWIRTTARGYKTRVCRTCKNQRQNTARATNGRIDHA